MGDSVRIVNTIITLGFVLLTIAPSTQPAQKPNAEKDVVWGDAEDGCRFRIAKFSAICVAGEALDIELEVENAGAHDTGFFVDGYDVRGDLLQIDAITDNGHVARPTQYALAEILSRTFTGMTRLEKGTIATIKVRLNQLVDLSLPGKYGINLKLHLRGDDKNHVLTMPPITVEITRPVLE